MSVGRVTTGQNLFKRDYETATYSNQKRAHCKQILTACALALTDESGYFVTKDVEKPLRYILRRNIGSDGFNGNLKEFIELKRGRIHQRIGTERSYRYRFCNPAMQPFAIMKGIAEGFWRKKLSLLYRPPNNQICFLAPLRRSISTQSIRSRPCDKVCHVFGVTCLLVGCHWRSRSWKRV